MPAGSLRNIGIVAHIDAGKTTVSERFLFYGGVERRMGEVHEGSAVMDWMEEERRRGITITSAATSVPWEGHTINLIDTPGHVDFTVEVERCMRVLDGAVLVINGVSGVQAQSETVWRQMVRHGVASVAFVNQLDRAGASFLDAVADLRKRLGVLAVPIQLPVGAEREFRTIVDLITGEAIEFPEDDFGRAPRVVPVPAELADEVGVLRSELIEILAEGDDELLEVFLDEREPEPEALHRALRRRVRERTLMPVLCGAALRNVGVQPLLDAVVRYLPSPDAVPPLVGRIADSGEEAAAPPNEDGPLCALAFKYATDPNEDLVFVRIYSGAIEPGQKIYNTRVGRMERVARLLRMHADERIALERAGPGDIVALSGCKFTATGDTLAEHGFRIQLERPIFPEPVITRVVEPGSTKDRDKLRVALERLAFEDPSFRVTEDEETGQWLIAGMGELHLEIKEHALAELFRLEVRVGQPRVAYREAPLGAARGAGKIDRTLGGSRVFGAVELEVRPTGELGGGRSEVEAPEAEAPEADPAGAAEGHVRVTWAADCAVPEEFRAAIEESLALEARVGPRFGYPMMGLAVEVVGGESHPERDTELGFLQAASLALRQALEGAQVALLEPLMEFEIQSPADFMSGIIGELNAKKADIADLSVDGEERCVTGQVPLYRMFGYASTLRSLSQGRASFSLIPAGFRPVPEDELEARGLVWQ